MQKRGEGAREQIDRPLNAAERVVPDLPSRVVDKVAEASRLSSQKNQRQDASATLNFRWACQCQLGPVFSGSGKVITGAFESTG